MRKLLLMCALVFGFTAALPAERAEAQENPFLGQISWFAGNFAPRGWALCDGQILPISQNQALFSLLGTTYGGDGRTSFALPDMRGRVPYGSGDGSSQGLTSYALGAKGGVETVTLTAAQIPSHDHSVTLHASSGNGGETSADGNALAESTQTMYGGRVSSLDATLMAGSATFGSGGGGQAHENLPPYLALNCIIALQGIFPSRN